MVILLGVPLASPCMSWSPLLRMTPVRLGQDPFSLNYLYKGPVSKYSHILRSWAWGLQHVNGGGHNSAQNTGPPRLWPRILTALCPCRTCAHMSGRAPLNPPHSSFSPASLGYATSTAKTATDPDPLPWSRMGNHETFCARHDIFISSQLKIFFKWKQDILCTHIVYGSKIKILIYSLWRCGLFLVTFQVSVRNDSKESLGNSHSYPN